MSYQRVVGFGEAMLRLTPPEGATVEAATSFAGSVGGAELNGLIAAARSGMPATWVSALPDNPLGQLVRRHARANDVDTVIVQPPGPEPSRLGTYFLEMARAPRPLRITYDRAWSAFAELDAADISWDELLDADACLYVTGINPPLGPGPRKAVEDAVRVAGQVGATVAVDMNYREALWARDEAGRWLASVLPDVDLLSAGVDDLAHAGVTGSDPFAEALDRFGLQAVLTTAKRTADLSVDLDLRVLTPDGAHAESAQVVVVDPVGAGDALFGTFLATFPAVGAAAAAERALGAAVTCYGLFGDALVADPWAGGDSGRVLR
jgi:2-dehydro-3-deoxygluconokinase